MAVFAIRRTAGNEELICLANFSKYGQNAWLNCLEGEYEDLFTGEKTGNEFGMDESLSVQMVREK